MSQDSTRSGQLVLVPALITLAVTGLRLAGELLNWSPRLFGKAAGGGASLVGITWLVPIFGAWFGWKLARAGQGPAAVGRGLAVAIGSFLLLPAVGFAGAGAGLNPESLWFLAVYAVAGIVGVAVGLVAWPALARTLVVYGLTARIPVAVLMLFAMLGNWGTHYDVAPPNVPQLSPFAKWLALGLAPQLTIWIWFTVAVGLIFGIVAAAIARRRVQQAAVAA